MLDVFSAAVSALGGKVKATTRVGNKALQCSVAGITDLVRSFGLYGHSSKTKRLPAEIYGLALDQVGRLLGLLWAGDGWFERNKAAMTLANRLLLEDIRHLLLRIGVHPRIRRSSKRFH